MADVILLELANGSRYEVWQRLEAMKAELSPRMLTQLLSRLARRKRLSTALHVLSFMKWQRVEMNAFHYSAALNACAQCGDWTMSLGLLQRMGEGGVQGDVFIQNTVISACGKSAHWQISTRISSTDTLNVLLKAFQVWELSLHALELASAAGVQSDAISMSSAMACEKGWRRSLQLMSSICAKSLEQDDFGRSAVMSKSHWELALSIRCQDVVAYGSLLKALDGGTRWALALLIEDELSEKGPVTCNSAMSACSSRTEWQHTMALLRAMPHLRVLRQDVSYNTAICACVRGDRWQEGLGLFQSMPEVRVEPDHISFNSVLSACHQSSQWQLALNLLALMSSRKLEADEFCYTTALSACEVAGWPLCLQLLSSVDEVTPIMFGVLMSACERSSAWEAALATLQAIQARGFTPDALHVGSAANALHKACGEKASLTMLYEMKRIWCQNWKGVSSEISLQALGHRREVLRVGDGAVACLKPAGVATETFVDELATACQGSFSIVSRLDHPTSGILMLALGPQGCPAANWLQVQFASRLVDKKYICLCQGPSLGAVGTTGTIDAPLFTDEVQGRTEVDAQGREAVTKYRVLSRYVATAPSELILLSVKPVTGRTHQIRVHLAYLGCPLVGDLTYGTGPTTFCQRLFLHCRRVRLRDVSGEFGAVASLPTELRTALNQLEKWLGRFEHLQGCDPTSVWERPGKKENEKKKRGFHPRQRARW